MTSSGMFLDSVGKCFLLHFVKDVMFFSFTNKTLAIAHLQSKQRIKGLLGKPKQEIFSNRTLDKKTGF